MILHFILFFKPCEPKKRTNCAIFGKNPHRSDFPHACGAEAVAEYHRRGVHLAQGNMMCAPEGSNDWRKKCTRHRGQVLQIPCRGGV